MHGRSVFFRSALATVAVSCCISFSACFEGAVLNPSPNTFHVAPHGDDANDGSSSFPWRTIQHAANVLRAGETAYVHEGEYRERVQINVSGSPALGSVTFVAYPGDRPTLDGRNLPLPVDNAAMLLIEDHSHVIVDGFEIRNDYASQGNQFPSGILILGASSEIVIRNCIIHHIGNNRPAIHGDGPFAHGIAVYGTRAPQAARAIRIEGNELHHLETGGSEALVVNGNVDGFEILDNYIHHVNNIAIDCIGYEGTSPDDAFDRARHGIVRGNRIEDASGVGNRFYSDPYGALGIYIDGAFDVVVERNMILRTDFGLEIASEHPERTAQAIRVHSNVIAESRTVGLSIGGWIEDWGGASDVVIVNNTFYRNDALRAGHGEVALLRHLSDIRLFNNLIVAREQGGFLLNEATTGDAVRVDFNLYVSSGGTADALWIWNGVEYTTFHAYREASGNDRHSLVARPLFEDDSDGRFLLRRGSPGIDAGDNAAIRPFGPLDIAGRPRIVDGDGDGRPIVDLGAYETPTR